MAEGKAAVHDLNIFINQKKHEVTRTEMTPREILETLAHENVQEVVLASKDQGQLTKYTNLDEPIPLRNGLHFVVMHLGPTSVS